MNQPPPPGCFPQQPVKTRRRPGRYALALLTVLATAASIFLLVSLSKPVVSAVDREGGTRVTLTAHPPDGSPPTAETLSQAQRVIGKRVSDAQVSGFGDTLTVTVPGRHQSFADNLSQVGRLNIRPMMHAIPAHPMPTTGRRPFGAAPGGLNGADLAGQIAVEKRLRQTTSQMIQVLSMHYQATRCDAQDALADNDDPSLPLVTCSADHKFSYVLGPSIISSNQIRSARSSFDQQDGRYVVDLQFNGTGANSWAQYAAAHRGNEVAYTLDTQVISAPRIGSSAQITSDLTAFTSDSAHQLAITLSSGPLPIPFEASKPEAVAPKAGSAGLWQSRPPIGLVITAIGVVVILVCLQAYLYRPGNYRSLPPPAGVVTDVAGHPGIQ
jgi:preprotein translocase subunit SecD